MFSWGCDTHVHNRDLFTVFDVERHWTVQQRAREDSLHSIVQTAANMAPFEIRSVQILTVPVPGLPRPQLVLSRARDPVNLVPIPWDARPIGGDIRTIGHQASENALVFSDKVQQAHPDLPHLKSDILTEQVVVLDALGFVGDTLPEDLEQVQHFRVEGSAAAFFGFALGMSSRPAAFADYGRTLSSTSTTTPQGEPTDGVYRLTVIWGACVASDDVRPPCHQLDTILRRLILEVFACSPRNSPAHDLFLALAKEQPPPRDGVQEVLFVILGPGYDSCPTVIVDERDNGQALHATALSHQAQCNALVHPQWRNVGVSIVVNGAPGALACRHALTGDFLQFMDCHSRPASLPVAALFETMPLLMPFAWPLYIGEGTRCMDIEQAARQRRRQQGLWRHEEGSCLILGATHGPVCLRLGIPVVPDRTEAAQGVAGLDSTCPIHRTTLCETTLIEPGKATFITALPNSPYRSILIPHVDCIRHQMILLVLEQAIQIGPLPVAPGSLCRRPPREWKDGDVIEVAAIAESAVPEYERLAAAQYPHLVPACPPADSRLAQPSRIPTLTVARSDAPAALHIGWARISAPTPLPADNATTDNAASGSLSLLQVKARVHKRPFPAATGQGVPDAATTADQRNAGRRDNHCIPTPFGRRSVVLSSALPRTESPVALTLHRLRQVCHRLMHRRMSWVLRLCQPYPPLQNGVTHGSVLRQERTKAPLNTCSRAENLQEPGPRKQSTCIPMGLPVAKRRRDGQSPFSNSVQMERSTGRTSSDVSLVPVRHLPRERRPRLSTTSTQRRQLWQLPLSGRQHGHRMCQSASGATVRQLCTSHKAAQTFITQDALPNCFDHAGRSGSCWKDVPHQHASTG